MSKRKNGREKNGKDYEVGYGKPPLHSQFQPGDSGNPAGRRKGVRNLATDVKRTLSAPVKLNEGGRRRTMSTQESALMVLREKALRGDARLLIQLLSLAMRFNGADAAGTAEGILPPDDQAILDAFVAERKSSVISPADTESPDDPAPNPDTGSRDRRCK